ncbi:hypothetical protein AB0B25_04490 [Nocardia sp. NPDC049190]|uniref:hypothetical protein n=1 Tax=Nocardia sp. NPDC049190 TaxID=3155650 RepID=UPI0033C3C958
MANWSRGAAEFMRIARDTIDSAFRKFGKTYKDRSGRYTDELHNVAETEGDIEGSGRIAGADRSASHDGGPSGIESSAYSEYMKADTYYSGARLWQLEQIFPRAFRDPTVAVEEGYIRAASHGMEQVVYLTDRTDIADVYGTITKWTDVRDGAMRFHPAGMVLGVDGRGIAVRRMTPETSTAATFEDGTSNHVGTTGGPLDTSHIVSARFEVYEDVINTPDVHLVTDGFPGFEGMSQESLRDPTMVADRLSSIADAVRTHYPDINVSVGVNRLSVDDAVRIFKVSSVLILPAKVGMLAAAAAAGDEGGASQSDVA